MHKILLTILLLLPLIARSQDYTASAGLRGGYSSGLVFKGFAEEDKALEGLLSWREGGMQFTILLESYRPVFLEYSDHLFLYLGYGAHVGYTRSYHRYKDDFTIYGHPTYYYQRRASPVIGADVIAGLEYRLYRIPLAISLDIKPFAEILGNPFFDLRLGDMAFSVRYTF